jgi:curved DNA-binding protein CbpA
VTPSPEDPYKTLGVSPGVSDAELRSAYRRLVRLHHPDHNGGSVESARRFEAVQEAYSRIRELRKTAPRAGARTGAGATGGGATGGRATGDGSTSDPGLEARLRDIERELHEAQRAREQAQREAAQARREAAQARRDAREAATGRPGRATDEELGYVTTDDSFSKIVADVWDELSDRFSEAREHPAVKRVEDLIDELDPRHRSRQ